MLFNDASSTAKTVVVRDLTCCIVRLFPDFFGKGQFKIIAMSKRLVMNLYSPLGERGAFSYSSSLNFSHWPHRSRERTSDIDWTED